MWQIGLIAQQLGNLLQKCWRGHPSQNPDATFNQPVAVPQYRYAHHDPTPQLHVIQRGSTVHPCHLQRIVAKKLMEDLPRHSDQHEQRVHQILRDLNLAMAQEFVDRVHSTHQTQQEQLPTKMPSFSRARQRPLHHQWQENLNTHQRQALDQHSTAESTQGHPPPQNQRETDGQVSCFSDEHI